MQRASSSHAEPQTSVSTAANRESFDTVLDATTVAVAYLDAQGRIRYVNAALRALAYVNHPDQAERVHEGADFLSLCRGANPPHGLAVARGIELLLHGERASFDMEYASHSASEPRWFMLHARPPQRGDGVVITIVDVTDAHIAEARSRIQSYVAQAFFARTPLSVSCGELARVICERLAWDFTAVWMLDVSSGSLQCIDTWMNAELQLSAFERACQGARLGPGIGIPGRAWSSRHAVWVIDRDLESDAPGGAKLKPRTVMPPAALTAGFHSGLAFPIRFEDDVLAVIEILGRVRHARDEKFLRLLELAGGQLATGELRDRAERRAEAAKLEANASREQLEAVLECAPVGVFAVDRLGDIRFVNRGQGDLSKEQCVNKPWRDCVPKAQHARFEVALAQVIATGTPQVFDLSTPDENGRPHWYTHHVGPMHDALGIAGAVVVSQDVTQFRHAQDELVAAQRLAAIGTMAAGVAHEINTPLQFVGDSIEFLRESGGEMMRAFSELENVRREAQLQRSNPALQKLAEDALQVTEDADLSYVLEQLPRALERCVEGLGRVTSIVRSMKEFSHPAQKEMQAADLNRAIAATLTVARNEYKYVADVETDYGTLPLVMCHLNEINQTVLNILVNAAHAIEDRNRGTTQRGWIKVTTRCENDYVVITIEDNGGGIPEGVRQRVFEPFFTTKEVGRGTGQGLAMAWTTVKEKHKGELAFDTKLGEGTVFRIKLPVNP